MRLTTRLARRDLLGLLLLPFFVAFAVGTAHAGGGSGLPWEGPLTQVQQSLSGTTAKAISIIAIVVAGAALVFGEDLGQFARRLILVVLAVALIMLASSFLTTLFGGGALI